MGNHTHSSSLTDTKTLYYESGTRKESVYPESPSMLELVRMFFAAPA